jgi:hypothetical protein
MIAYMYPRELQVLAGRGYAGCLDGCFQGYQGEVMQDLASELPRIPIPRTPVNKGEEKDRRLLCSEGQHVHPKHCFTQAKAPPERGLLGEQENLPSCTDCWAR